MAEEITKTPQDAETAKQTPAEIWQQEMDQAKALGISREDAAAGLLRGMKRAEIRALRESIRDAQGPDAEEAEKLIKDFIWNDPSSGMMPGGDKYIEDKWFKKMIQMTNRANNYITELFPVQVNGRVLKTQFTPGTLNVIGGRPGAGKTGALISLALEAIERGREVLYITNDEPKETLIARMQMSLLARKYYFDPVEDKNPLATGLYDSDDVMARILVCPEYADLSFMYRYLEMMKFPVKCPLTAREAQYPCAARAIYRARKDGYEAFLDHFRRGGLRIIDPRELRETGDFDWQDFRAAVKDQPAGTLVMVDYIQSMDIYPGKRQREFLDQQRSVVSGLTDLARETGLIFVCAAQLRRADEREDKMRMLSLSDFSDTSEIEKRATLAIGLAKATENGENSRYYYRIIKDRLNEIKGQYWLDKDGYAYSFVHADRAEDGSLIKTPSEAELKLARKQGEKSATEKKDPERQCLEEAEAETRKRQAAAGQAEENEL